MWMLSCSLLMSACFLVIVNCTVSDFQSFLRKMAKSCLCTRHSDQKWLRGLKLPHLDLSLSLLCMPQVVLHLLQQPALRTAAETMR